MLEKSLKEMGVFVGSGIGDISNFISNGYQIEYKWEDPINKIISIIKS
jgi:3-oxoacyl-(acyl-carrier-protein) synthase